MLSGYTAIYGGSFDPPHVGHQMVCLYLTEALNAKEVWLVPTFVHAFNKSMAPFEHRVAMCEKMTAPLSSSIKIEQSEKLIATGGKTLLLLNHFSEKFPDRKFSLVIGSDILQDCTRWYKWNEIEKSYRVTVLQRTGYETGVGVAFPLLSSTGIRQRILENKDIAGLIPHGVKQYIYANNLYR